jgi:hypothetical protein
VAIMEGPLVFWSSWMASTSGTWNLRRARKRKRREQRKARAARSKPSVANIPLAVFDEEVDGIVKACFDEPAPSVLYHYAKWSGAEGVIGSQRFWVTDYRCTNDRAELVSADPAAIEVATELRGRFSDVPATRLLDLFLEGHEGNRVSRIVPVYLSCFSTAPDIPEQWRDYGDDGRGLCLGIKLLHDEKFEDPSLGRSIFSVDYSETSWKTTLRDGLSRIVEAFSRFAKQRNVNPNPPARVALNGMYRVAAFTSMTAKHATWAHESEWRHVVFPAHGATITPKHRQSDGRDIEYLDVPMRSNGLRIAFEKIVIGPTQDGDQAKVRLRDILLAAGYREGTPEWPEIVVSQFAVATKSA